MINFLKLNTLLHELEKVTYDNPNIALRLNHGVYGKYKLYLNPQQNALFGEPLDERAERYWNNKFEKLSKENQKARANELCINSSTWNYVDVDKLVYLLVMDCGEWSAYDPEEEKKAKIKEFEIACYKSNIGTQDFLSLLKYYEPIKEFFVL